LQVGYPTKGWCIPKERRKERGWLLAAAAGCVCVWLGGGCVCSKKRERERERERELNVLGWAFLSKGMPPFFSPIPNQFYETKVS